MVQIPDSLVPVNRGLRALVGLGPREKFGRNVTSQNAEYIVRHIIEMQSYLGKTSSWQRDFIYTIKQWLIGSAGHAEIRDELVALSTLHRGTPAQTFFVAQVTGAIGHFSASLEFEKLGVSRASKVRVGRSRLARSLTELQAAIHTSDLKLAINKSEAVKQILSSRTAIPMSILEILQYVHTWVGSEMASSRTIDAEGPVNHRWMEAASGRNFVVYGPGETRTEQDLISDNQLVVRIAGPGSFHWAGNSDLARGRADVVYMNPETMTSIMEQGGDSVEILKSYPFVCVKRGQSSLLPNSRRIDAGARLFLRGHPNMVPLIVLDLIKVPGSRIHVIGSDFFASAIAYRDDSRRVTPGGLRQTQQGSSGNLYDRCTLFASHNVFQNRRLISNLVHAGRVSGDRSFMEACLMSDQEYARRLDLFYGQDRV